MDGRNDGARYGGGVYDATPSMDRVADVSLDLIRRNTIVASAPRAAFAGYAEAAAEAELMDVGGAILFAVPACGPVHGADIADALRILGAAKDGDLVAGCAEVKVGECGAGFDLRTFDMYSDGDVVRFATSVQTPITNPWGGNHMSTQRFHILLADTVHANGAAEDGSPTPQLPGTNTFTRGPWRKAVVVDGRNDGARYGGGVYDATPSVSVPIRWPSA